MARIGVRSTPLPNPPPQGQGYRIWKIQSRIRDLAARGVRLPPPRLGIGLRTDRNRNTNCDCARLAHAVRDSFWRASFFHMRFPCHQGGGEARRGVVISFIPAPQACGGGLGWGAFAGGSTSLQMQFSSSTRCAVSPPPHPAPIKGAGEARRGAVSSSLSSPRPAAPGQAQPAGARVSMASFVKRKTWTPAFAGVTNEYWSTLTFSAP